MRTSGLLMHISSLPGPGGIGSLGQEAYAFADYLKKSGMTLWQVLPVGPTGYGESPYQSASVHAGNPLLISTARLREEGLLDEATHLTESGDRVDYDAVRTDKERLLRRCFALSEGKLRGEVAAFTQAQPWVEDFALFTALKEHFGGAMWTKWPEEGLRLRRPEALAKWRRDLAADVRYHIFVQYLFRRQWDALKSYCNERGIRLLGDMPIYVAEDSADTWTRPEVFQLDKDRVPTRVAGVPPDCFSADGQLWGNPLYRWRRLFFHRYDWWVERMRGMAELYDIIRIDHFIGFANYYSIPYGAKDAKGGKWVIGPGKKLFKALRRELPDFPIVAEDLGNVNDRVKRLLTWSGYPGMRVLSFGFGGGDENPHLPQNYVTNSVVYTGTHDNDTVRSWFEHASPEEKAQAKRVLGIEKAEDAPWAFIRAVMESRADTCVIPVQDVLALPGSARMNLPGTIGGNWLWRMLPGALTDEISDKLLDMTMTTDRGTK